MASRGVNKVILLGTLGADPEVRFMPNGNAVANISVATNESWKDKNTGQMQEKTEWHRVVIFGKLAEVAGEYLKKGAQVYFEGKLQTRKWQDQNGQDKYTTEIVVDMGGQMQMLGGRNNNDNGGGYSNNNYNQNQGQQQNQGGYEPRQQSQSRPSNQSGGYQSNQGANQGQGYQSQGNNPSQGSGSANYSSNQGASKPAQNQGGYQQPNQGGFGQASQQQAPAQQRPAPTQQQQQNYSPNIDDSWDDDIPF